MSRSVDSDSGKSVLTRKQEIRNFLLIKIKKIKNWIHSLPIKNRNKKVRKRQPLFTEDKRIRQIRNGTSCWCSMALTKRRGQRIDLEQVSRGQLLTNTTLLDYRGQLLTYPKFSTISRCWSKNNLSKI